MIIPENVKCVKMLVQDFIARNKQIFDKTSTTAIIDYRGFESRAELMHNLSLDNSPNIYCLAEKCGASKFRPRSLLNEYYHIHDNRYHCLIYNFGMRVKIP